MRAIVTEAGSEEGRALAHDLARGGAFVLAVDLDRAAAGRTAASAPGGEVLPHGADIHVAREWDGVMRRVTALWGGVDVVLRGEPTPPREAPRPSGSPAVLVP